VISPAKRRVSAETTSRWIPLLGYSSTILLVSRDCSTWNRY
jgi:hypothetical protein